MRDALRTRRHNRVSQRALTFSTSFVTQRYMGRDSLVNGGRLSRRLLYPARPRIPRGGRGESKNPVAQQGKKLSSSRDLAAVILSAGFCTAWLWLFADRFAVGATWSGLNPNGGGPGFLLLASAGCSSFFLRSSRARSLSAIAATIHTAAMAAVCGLLFYASSRLLLSLPDHVLPPLMSGVIGSFFVPRVVVSVLNESWQHAEASRVGRGKV